MVISKYVKCNSCEHLYRLRYNVGSNFPQSASFFCKTCGQPITYGYDNRREILLENAVLAEGDMSTEVINLHPELTIDEERQGDPSYFPSIEYMARTKAAADIYSFRRTQVSSVAYVREWDAISEDFRRLSEQLWPLLRKKYGADDAKTQETILTAVIDIADHFLEGKWTNCLQCVLVELDKAKEHADFEAMKSYLAGFKEEFLLHRMYQVMSQYRQVETELLSTLLAQKRGGKSEGYSSSAKWEKIERIYGDFYEVYGELAVIPTVLNNLLTRDHYAQFATAGFTLDDYMTTDKAKRCVNFAANENLKSLGDFYDASLRNGTHHKTAKINKSKQKIVLKTGKGGQSEKVWSFVEYIEHCNELYARCLMLFVVCYRITK